MAGIGPLSTKSFEQLTLRQQNKVQYEYLISLDDGLKKLQTDFKNRKFTDKGFAVVGGVMGAYTFLLGKAIFWK